MYMYSKHYLPAVLTRFYSQGECLGTLSSVHLLRLSFCFCEVARYFRNQWSQWNHCRLSCPRRDRWMSLEIESPKTPASTWIESPKTPVSTWTESPKTTSTKHTSLAVVCNRIRLLHKSTCTSTSTVSYLEIGDVHDNRVTHAALGVGLIKGNHVVVLVRYTVLRAAPVLTHVCPTVHVW